MNLLSKTQLYFHISFFFPQAADFQECWQHISLFQTYMFQVLVYSGVAWNLQKKWCVILLADSRLLICWLGMSNWFGAVFRGNECGAQLTVMSYMLGDKTWRMEHGHNTRPQSHQSLKPEWELWGCHIQDVVSALSAVWMVTSGKKAKSSFLVLLPAPVLIIGNCICN